MNTRSPKKYPFPRTPRWSDYEYSQPGAYYVTMATAGRLNILGATEGRQVNLTRIGEMVEVAWLDLRRRFQTVELDSYVIMPDHLHGIIHIHASEPGVGKPRSTQTQARPKLTDIVGAFKSLSTIEVNKSQNTAGRKLWQRSFYERVVRNEREMDKFRGYIVNNPTALALQISKHR